MTLEQMTYEAQLITDDPYEQDAIRRVCLRHGRDERERLAGVSLWERFWAWLFGTEDVA